MIERVIARAHANIALIKYWGKRPGALNAPATPSISLTLDVLTTTTAVSCENLDTDQFYFNGSYSSGKNGQRVLGYTEKFRKRFRVPDGLKIESSNTFPSSAGLASSASGFAALATALSGLAEKPIQQDELSRLARIGSGSAARSIPGGLVKMALHDDPCAETILPPDDVPWGMVIGVVESGAKEKGSTVGMEHSRISSPFYQTWLETAASDYSRMLAAIERLDFEEIGNLTEANMYAMHACMSSSRPALVYWKPETLTLLESAREWRNSGLQVYVTVDAGANVIFIGNLEDLAEIQSRVSALPGVKNCYLGRPGNKAELIT